MFKLSMVFLQTEMVITLPNNSNFGGKNPNMVCQFCGKCGHAAKQCYHAKTILLRENPPTTNHATTRGSNDSSSSWLVDSGAFHHATIDLSNLSPTSLIKDSITLLLLMVQTYSLHTLVHLLLTLLEIPLHSIMFFVCLLCIKTYSMSHNFATQTKPLFNFFSLLFCCKGSYYGGNAPMRKEQE